MSRADRIAVLILVLLVLCTWIPRFKGPIDLRWDAGVYYILGTSLAEGKGYRLLNEPGEIEATIYPPLLPAIVAGHQLVLGTSDPVVVGPWLRGFFFLLSVAHVLATYTLLRTAASVPYAWLGTLVCSLTFLAVWLSDRCYTDLPFAVAMVAFVLPASAAARIPPWPGVAAVLAFLLRTIGAALLAAWVAEALLRRNYRKALLRTAIALLPILAWQLYVTRVQQGPGYAQPMYSHQRADYNIYNVTYAELFSLRDHLQPELGRATAAERARRAAGALPRILTGLGGAISQPREHWELVFDRVSRVPVARFFVPWRGIAAAMMLLGALAVAGLVVQMRRGEVLLPICTLVYLAGLCSMPHSYFGELPRYLWVLSPLLMLSTFHAVAAAYRLRHHVPRSLAAAGIAGCAALASFVVGLSVFTVGRAYATDLRPVVHADWNGRSVSYRLFSYTDYEAFDGGLAWLKRHAAPTDVVASTTPQWVYLRTGLRSVFPPFERDAVEARKQLDSVPVRYVVVADWLSRQRVRPIVESAVSSWEVAYSDGDFAIYRRRQP